MSSNPADPTAWPASAPEAWQATRAQTALATQVMLREEDESEASKRDIGRPVGANQRELFVSCAPPEALQQQFEHLQPEFIAVHDIGTTSSRRLLSGIAAASGRALQKLSIRRQGYGTALATLEYVELPTNDGSSLRIYSTDVDADTTARHGLARTLLAFSSLGVVMVGDLPSHSIETAFKSIHDEMTTGQWPNRHLLLLPLANANAVATHGASLAVGTRVTVRTTPQVTRPADAWGFINGSWGRLKAQGPATPAPAASARAPRFSMPETPAPRVSDDSGFAATQVMTPATPLPMRPMPDVVRNRAPAAPQSVLQRYVQQLSELSGVVSVCVFEMATGRDVAHAGASPSATELGSHGAELVASISASCRALGLGHAIPDAAVTLSNHHLLLRPVPRHPGLALHAVLDKTNANLTLARLQVQRLDAMFDGTAPTGA